MDIDYSLSPKTLNLKIERLFALSGEKILRLEKEWDPEKGSPVFTVEGKYTSRSWTEWTRGFQFGSALLQFDGAGGKDFLELGRKGTVSRMTGHLTHRGVHDHGFNIISTFGNLLRLCRENKIPCDDWEVRYYELALMVSGAVQACRWTELTGGYGYIPSFNGPHSLFIDSLRTLRSLGVSHLLGHHLSGEQDRKINLLERLIQHGLTTIRWNIYFGEGRDSFDERGRTAHEAVFNVNSGSFRTSATQQGYSPFTTWTRGLAWAVCGLAEQLEFLSFLPDSDFQNIQVGEYGGKEACLTRFREAAEAVADFYMESTPSDGIPYWDTGAPGLVHLDGYRTKPANPYNDREPVDSSAAGVAAQGLLRLGRFLEAAATPAAGPPAAGSPAAGSREKARRYFQAGLGIAAALFDAPYLSEEPDHQGLILHSVYHRPAGWDHIPKGRKVPCGESSMWGDYHALELALYIKRLADSAPYLCFFSCMGGKDV